jgi:hypothetical protein
LKGFEPLASSLPRKCSTPELQRLGFIKCHLKLKPITFNLFPTLRNRRSDFRLLDFFQQLRAGDEARTRDLQLGRLSLYQLSYSRNLLISTRLLKQDATILVSPFTSQWLRIVDVGSGGFEPPKPKQQIYSLSHLATLETPLYLAMSHLSGSNQRPTDYKSVALPAELKWHVKERFFYTKFLEFCKKDCKKSTFY